MVPALKPLVARQPQYYKHHHFYQTCHFTVQASPTILPYFVSTKRSREVFLTTRTDVTANMTRVQNFGERERERA